MDIFDLSENSWYILLLFCFQLVKLRHLEFNKLTQNYAARKSLSRSANLGNLALKSVVFNCCVLFPHYLFSLNITKDTRLLNFLLMLCHFVYVVYFPQTVFCKVLHTTNKIKESVTFLLLCDDPCWWNDIVLTLDPECLDSGVYQAVPFYEIGKDELGKGTISGRGATAQWAQWFAIFVGCLFWGGWQRRDLLLGHIGQQISGWISFSPFRFCWGLSRNGEIRRPLQSSQEFATNL